ncbi:MAG: hypothetical protein R6V07_01945 [Armatimonadota bacterium]
MSLKYYEPDATTAMLEAIGFTPERFDYEVLERNDVNYLVIISDGEENASPMYSYPRISGIIQVRRKTGCWTFVYVAKQDLPKVLSNLSIPRGSTLGFRSTPRSTKDAFHNFSESVISHMQMADSQRQNTEKLFPDDDIDDEDNDSGKAPGSGYLQ